MTGCSTPTIKWWPFVIFPASFSQSQWGNQYRRSQVIRVNSSSNCTRMHHIFPPSLPGLTPLPPSFPSLSAFALCLYLLPAFAWPCLNICLTMSSITMATVKHAHNPSLLAIVTWGLPVFIAQWGVNVRPIAHQCSYKESITQRLYSKWRLLDSKDQFENHNDKKRKLRRQWNW